MIVGHSCGSSDVHYHLEMLDRGAVLGFDRFGLEILHPDRERLAVLIGLLGIGFARQLVLSHDTVWCWRGRAPKLPPDLLPIWKPTYVFETIVPRLREAGVSDEKIHTMLVENPRRYFAWRRVLAPTAEDHDAGVGAAADRVRERDARVRHLRAPASPRSCQTISTPVRSPKPERLALREEPAARVDRHRRSISPPPSRTQRPPPRARAQPELLGRRISRAASVSCSSTI